jgi:hypothetical protein
LDLQAHGVNLEDAIEFVQRLYLERLRAASKAKKFKFKSSGPHSPFAKLAVSNELEWLLKHFHVLS